MFGKRKDRNNRYYAPYYPPHPHLPSAALLEEEANCTIKSFENWDEILKTLSELKAQEDMLESGIVQDITIIKTETGWDMHVHLQGS